MATLGARPGRRVAKDPLSPVAGPYGHPFHPILVTIPIGAWVSSLVFDLTTRAGDGSTALVRASFWLILIGVIAAGAAALFGLMDLLTIPRGTRAFLTGLTHAALNVVILGMFLGNWFWRRANYDVWLKVSVGQIVLTAVAIALLLVSGYLGGTLAYRFGVRVASDEDQAEGLQHP